MIFTKHCCNDVARNFPPARYWLDWPRAAGAAWATDRTQHQPGLDGKLGLDGRAARLPPACDENRSVAPAQGEWRYAGNGARKFPAHSFSGRVSGILKIQLASGIASDGRPGWSVP